MLALQSSNFNHLWHNNFLSFNKLLLCYLFLFIFTCEALPHRGHSTQCSALHIREFAVGICRENLPWLFAVGICHGYLPWVFAVCICKQIVFCICGQILFIWKQTFLICEQYFFVCDIFFINSVSFCYCRGSYGPPYWHKGNYI